MVARKTGPSRALHDSLSDRLDDGIRQLGLEASQDVRDRLLRFVGLLAKWNAVYNLTSVREMSDMLTVHVLDALSIVPVVDALHSTLAIDVGSGAGLPAIPLALMRPGLGVRSIDAVAKKIGFQLQVKADLHLDNLNPVHQRIEAATAEPRPDLIVSRAYADLSRMLASVEHLVDERCKVVAMKGVTPSEELALVAAPWRVASVQPLTVPNLGAQRCVVVIERDPGARTG